MSSDKHCCVPRCKNSRGTRPVLHGFPNPEKDKLRFNTWLYSIGGDILELENAHIFKYRRVCHIHFEDKYVCRNSRISNIAVPTLHLSGFIRVSQSKLPCVERKPLQELVNQPIPSTSTETMSKTCDKEFELKSTKLEVCIDSLESAINALNGGADELELCSALAEGGLTPSPGLVKEITKLIKSETKWDSLQNDKKRKVNVMIRCRGGSDFCYTESEMKTMLSDIEFYKEFDVDRFVFGALTDGQEIDIVNCTKVIEKAHPIPVTFHRAFDLCKDPKTAITDIIFLGFNRVLTSGQKTSAADEMALQLLKFLLANYGDKIEIMPGAGVNCDNANVFVESGFNIIHSSCRKIKLLADVNSDLKMGTNEIYVTDESIVKTLKGIIKTDS